MRRRRRHKEGVCLLEGDVDTLDLDVVEDVSRSAQEDSKDVEAVVDDVVEDDLAPHSPRADGRGDEGEECAEDEECGTYRREDEGEDCEGSCVDDVVLARRRRGAEDCDSCGHTNDDSRGDLVW